MKRRSAALVVLVAAAWSVSAPSPDSGGAVYANMTFVVNSTEDYINFVDLAPGDGRCETAFGDCTLRAAILETNALPGPQVIQLPAGEYVLLRAGCCENAANAGDLDITDDLTIAGAGAEQSLVTENSGLGSVERVFDIREDATVAISGLSVHDVLMTALLPFEEDCGGGIRSYGNLTLSWVAVRDNTFRRRGGGICNHGTLHMSDSLVASNHAALVGDGGGILNWGYALLERVTVKSNASDSVGGGGIRNRGVMVAKDSTITGNSASTAAGGFGGGGIGNGPRLEGEPAPSLTVINTTISGNYTTAGEGGGGVMNWEGAEAAFINSTITENYTHPDPFDSEGIEPDGGGLSNEEAGITTLVNTIVAGNENGDCRTDSHSWPPISLGHNLDGDGSCGLGEPGDVSGANPYLGPLADNGGPTMTHALLTVGSPAVEGGDNAQCPATDQRAAPRPVDGDGSGAARCDIGAFEYHGEVPPPGPEPRGDADCDSAVTVLDVLYVLRLRALGDALPMCTGTADVDCSGDVDDIDALFMLYHVADLPVAAC